MEKKYCYFRCLNRTRKDDDSYDCHTILGGIPKSDIDNHNFEESPIVLMEYCSVCNSFWEITIKSPSEPVEYRLLPNEKVLIPINKLRVAINVIGRKIKKRRK